MSDADDKSRRDAPDTDDPGQARFFERLRGIFTRRPEDEGFAGALDDGQRQAALRLPRARREMIENVIAFDEKRVADVMAPRADIVAVDIDTPLDALIKTFAEAGHSRLPVFRGDLDDPVGMVHIKDVVALIADPQPFSGEPILKRIRRTVLYVPQSMRVTDLLLRMQASRVHMALVIDEFGGTDGLLTIEDLVEEIVGDINDEHDDEITPTIIARQGGGWEADGRVELEEFSETTGITVEGDGEEVDTIGGLVVAIAGRVPQRGEILSHGSGYDFEIIEADARKVRKVRIRRTPAPADANAQAGE
ncbi:MAG: hemolysin family protein [Parvularculaceae bacterium]|nr:HlyC/CorC family transporter [Parvularculaceae bacterium]